jgi:hypothetical protein
LAGKVGSETELATALDDVEEMEVLDEVPREGREGGKEGGREGEREGGREGGGAR